MAAIMDPGTAECMRLGQEYAAKLGGDGGGPNAFNASLLSPVSAGRDGTFLSLAQASGTDKVTSHAYHYLYTRYLQHARFSDLHILEVGLGCNMQYGPGASLKLWRAYLPCAKISFVEFNRECALKFRDSVEQEGGGKLYIGSQDDPELLHQIRTDAQPFGGFDMIIDDGSHQPAHQFAALTGLWRAVKPGGVYVLEDMHDSWMGQGNLQPVSVEAPAKAPLPLLIHLLHMVNCRSFVRHLYEPKVKAWCDAQAATSQFSNVINVDCMVEACALVKGASLPVPPVVGAHAGAGSRRKLLS